MSQGNDSTVPHEAAEPVAGGFPELEHPKQIGPFKILQGIGEGGMGVVYSAEQTEPIRRRVALKMMKAGMDSKDVLGRFEAERQALAVMDHPGIATVFDAGVSEAGKPYFVMEYVKGIPLTDYGDTHKLTTRQRLELFVPICRAVQHAHQKGVIHRDLKPSNVLITEQDDSPMPKIIDFGIAKAVGQRLTERTVVTHYGQAMGTPAYMSPEQAERSGLDVDTRTDVYSLGVMLYELLVGQLPLDPEEIGINGFMVQLVERDTATPTPSAKLSSLGRSQTDVAHLRSTDPKSLRRSLQGDLDWIVLKAIDKDRRRRYDTANALADDIERHLRDEPVVARPPTLGYRVGRWAKRNTGAAVAGGIAALGLFVGAVFATAGMVRARAAETLAQQEAETARQISDFLIGLFEVSDPGESRGNAVTAREILDRGAERIADELADQPLVRAELLLTIAEVYHSLGLFQPALEHAQSAVDTRRDLLGDDDLRLASGITKLGTMLQASGRFDDAEARLDEAIAIIDAAPDPDQRALGEALNALAGVHFARGSFEESETLFLRALAITEEEMGRDAQSTVEIMSNLGVLYHSTREYDRARTYLEDALAIQLRTIGEIHPDVAGTINSLAAVTSRQGNYEEAKELLEQSLGIQQQLFDGLHPDIAMVTANLGIAHERLDRLDEAERLHLESLRMREELFDDSHPLIAASLTNLSILYNRLERFGEAIPLVERILVIRTDALGPDHPRISQAMTFKAGLHTSLGQYVIAEDLLERATDIMEAARGEFHADLLPMLAETARLMRATGREDVAERIEQRATTIRDTRGDA